MAVLKEYFFPDATVAGDTVELVPLAGNGYTAPHSYYAFDLQAEGASGGGSLTIQFRFDERYTSILPYITVRTSSIAANVNASFIVASTAVDRVVKPVVLVFTDAINSADVTYEPPPIVIPGRPREGSTMTTPWARVRTANVDTEDYALFGRIYNFKIDALKIVPLPVLLSTLPR